MPAREIQEIKWIAALSEHGADFGGNRKKQSLSVGAASCEYAYCDGVNGNPGLGAPQGIAQERKGKVGCITSNPLIFSPPFFLFAVLGCNKRLGIALHSWGARPRSKPICHGGHFTALSSMTLLATLSASSPSGMYTALYHCVWRKQKNLPLNFLLLYTWFCFMKVL